MEETQLSDNLLPDYQSVSLKELSEYERIRCNTEDISRSFGINTLHDLLNYNNIKGGFREFKTFRTRVITDLIKICEKYSDSTVRDDFEKKCLENRNRHEFILDHVVDIDLPALAEMEHMSTRCYNVCAAEGLISLKRIISFYYEHRRHEFAYFRNSGEDTNRALVNICLKYEEYTNAIYLRKMDATKSFLPVNLFFGFVKLPVVDYKKVIVNKDGADYILLFALIDKMIDDYYIFHQKRHIQVFKSAFNCYNSSVRLTFEEIGKQLGITSERGRQITANIYSQFQRAFCFIKFGVDLNVFPDYIKLTDQPVIFVTDELANSINESEHTNFTPLFITFILSEMFCDKFIRLGDTEILFSNAIYRKNTFVRHLYLVNREVSSQFKFNNFLQYLELLVSSGRKVEPFISYSDLVSRFKDSEETDVKSIVEVMNTIIIHDFSTYFEIKEDGINLLRSGYKPILSYIIEILEKSNKPLHYKAIHKILVKQGTNTSNEEFTHYILIRNKNIFGLKGLGIYDLRSKGGLFGTIGDVAEQILRVRKKPASITSLERLICKELKVKKKSIWPMLFSLDKKKRFIKLPGHFVGLKEWGPLSPPYRKLKY
jgi:hypothetical protein